MAVVILKFLKSLACESLKRKIKTRTQVLSSGRKRHCPEDSARTSPEKVSFFPTEFSVLGFLSGNWKAEEIKRGDLESLLE